MRWFLDANALALGQVLAADAVEGAVDANQLHPVQQVVAGGHLLPAGNGARAIGGVSWQNPAGEHVAQRVGQHQARAAFDELARLEAYRGPGSGGRVFYALRSKNYDREPSFFRSVPGC